jgi:ketol-acid reductoisomerase
MQMYLEADVDRARLIDQQVTILGYGSQGRAHALNLRDSGFKVVVGLRRGGASWSKAEADGLVVKEPNAAVKGAAIVAFLTPDMVQKQLYASVVSDIAQGAALLFAHGFAVHFK